MIRILAFILLLIVSVAGYAGELSVRSLRADAFDLTARKYERLDRNNKPCAVVKVELPVEGCVFEGNVIDTQFKVNSYWVYLTEGTRRVDIRCPGFKTLSVVFASVSDISDLLSGVTYILDIMGYESAQSNALAVNGPGVNILVVSVKPSDAQGLSVKVDGVQQAVQNGQAMALSGYGRHTYLVEAFGYEPISGTAEVGRDDKTVVNVTLQESMAHPDGNPATAVSMVSSDLQSFGAPTIDGLLNKTEIKTNTANVSVRKAAKKEYEYVGGFFEGLAFVKLNNKWGFIDETGEIVIPLKYDSARNFSEGLAAVELNGKWGYINKADEIVAPFKYDDAGYFSEDLVSVKLDGKWGYIDKSGTEIIPFKYGYAKRFSEGLAAVWKNYWGYIDKNGKEIIPFKFYHAEDFSEGRADVMLKLKKGYIDKKGNFTRYK